MCTVILDSKLCDFASMRLPTSLTTIFLLVSLNLVIITHCWIEQSWKHMLVMGCSPCAIQVFPQTSISGRVNAYVWVSGSGTDAYAWRFTGRKVAGAFSGGRRGRPRAEYGRAQTPSMLLRAGQSNVKWPLKRGQRSGDFNARTTSFRGQPGVPRLGFREIFSLS